MTEAQEKTLLIFKEKHDDVYYLVEKPEDKHKVAYTVLKQRYNTGYMYPNKESLKSSFERDVENLKSNTNAAVFMVDTESESFINSPDVLKENVLKDKAKYEKAYARIEHEYKLDVLFVEKLEELLSMNPEDAIKQTFTNSRGRKLNLAWTLLRERSDYQYEGFREESFAKTPDFDNN